MIRFLRNVHLVGFSDACLWDAVQQHRRAISIVEVRRLLEATRHIVAHFTLSGTEYRLLPQAAAVQRRLQAMLTKLERREARLKPKPLRHD